MARKPKKAEPKVVKASGIDPKRGVRSGPDGLYDPANPAIAGTGRCRRRAACRSISRSASISGACTSIVSRARATRSPSPSWRAAGVRPDQHALHLEHGDRRVGARQADALDPAHRQRRAVRVGLRFRCASSQDLRAVAAEKPLPRRQCRPARAVSPRVGLFEEAAKEIRDILVQEGSRTCRWA